MYIQTGSGLFAIGKIRYTLVLGHNNWYKKVKLLEKYCVIFIVRVKYIVSIPAMW
jgi:hypothetical protein